MRIAITGASGFVGSHLANRLESEGRLLRRYLFGVQLGLRAGKLKLEL